ncbi:prolyl oligopeptidase family serine peptidase [Amycolatopsis sp. QT-25]|uniref:alpha/beta hydrolase family protein n=1 Tax=Amycolatopsis sp. QT-25 TaxID=3034022 RepID=UPI0023EC215E|nr:prolyl oligopeptidase family serine peptidase [Amycolatopsis sp. QT-25]WET76642.1 prolyl oligopeptidase family serine peptidase [Amycolatopsis sp. QT-25]
MIAVLLAAAVAVSSPAPVTAPNGDVSFTSHGVTLHGTVVAPEGRGGLAPGIVMVHGSGEHDRDDYRAEAEAFAEAGIATLIYDKRTEGYSLFERDYAVLADDALAAVRALRSRPGVDPARVGVWGLSEGGWVAPLAASKAKDVAFAVTVGANGVSPDRQQSWAFETYLRHGGVTGSMVDMVASTNMRTLAGAGLFPEAGYDPVPVLEKVRQPVLGLWGELDRLTPPGEAVRIFRETLERAGNRQYTLKVLPKAQHGLRRTTDGFDKLDGFAPGYLDLVGAWVNGVRNEPSADPPPPQERRSVAPAPLAWYETPWLQAGVWALALLAFAAYPATALFRRRKEVPLAGPARWLASTGLLATVGFLGYYITLTTGAAMAPGPVLFGRTLPWLALQLAAIGVVVAGVVTGISWWRKKDRGGVRVGMLLAGAVLFVPWAVHWGLLVP